MYQTIFNPFHKLIERQFNISSSNLNLKRQNFDITKSITSYLRLTKNITLY